MSCAHNFEFNLPAVAIPTPEPDDYVDELNEFEVKTPMVVKPISRSGSFELKHMIGHFNPNKTTNNRFMEKLMERYAEYYEPKEMKTECFAESYNMLEEEISRK
jgi:hypothetical protein